MALSKKQGQIIQKWFNLPIVKNLYVWVEGEPQPPGFPAMGVLLDCIEECVDTAEYEARLIGARDALQWMTENSIGGYAAREALALTDADLFAALAKYRETHNA